jgi:hypothetical protein
MYVSNTVYDAEISEVKSDGPEHAPISIQSRGNAVVMIFLTYEEAAKLRRGLSKALGIDAEAGVDPTVEEVA